MLQILKFKEACEILSRHFTGKNFRIAYSIPTFIIEGTKNNYEVELCFDFQLDCVSNAHIAILINGDQINPIKIQTLESWITEMLLDYPKNRDTVDIVISNSSLEEFVGENFCVIDIEDVINQISRLCDDNTKSAINE